MITKNLPKVTIGVPIYNVSKYIERCAVSLLEQTYDNIEYIFVNDQTPDNSIEILKDVIDRYPKRKEQIVIIDHNPNRGLAATRNTTIDSATGDFIMWCDSDDWLDVHAVEYSVKKQIETNADIVSFRSFRNNNNKLILLDECLSDDRDIMIENLIYKGVNHIWARLIRTSLYLENNIRTVEGINMGEDYQVVIPLFYYSKKITSLSEPLYYYECSNANSYTSSLLSCKNQSQILSSFNVVDVFLAEKGNAYKDAVEKRNFKHTVLISIRSKYVSYEDYNYIKSRIKYRDCLTPKQRLFVMIIGRRVMNLFLQIF